MRLSEAQRRVLSLMLDTANHGGFAVACDGKDRAPAHELDKLGYATWKGESWGSSFWAITDAGRRALGGEDANPDTGGGE